MQSGLVCLELVAKLNQVPLDARALVREYGLTDEEVTSPELVRMLKQQGFKSKVKRFSSLHKMAKYPLPAIFKFNNGSYGTLLKLNSEDEKILLFSVADKQAH